MDGGQKAHPAVGSGGHGQQILPNGDLIHGDDLGIGRPQQNGDAHRLGAGVQHVGVPSHRHLGDSLVHHGDLPPLVHHGHPVTRQFLRSVGQAPDQIPQQGGFPQPRRRQHHRAAKLPVPKQLRQDDIPQPRLLPANAYGHRRQVPQVGVYSVPQHGGAAHAYPESAPGGEISPAQGLPGGVAGIVRHRVAQLLQVRLGHRRRQIAGARDHLSLRQQHRHGSSRPQAQLLCQGHLPRGQLPGLLLPPQRQQCRRLLITPDGIALVHVPRSFSCDGPMYAGSSRRMTAKAPG